MNDQAFVVFPNRHINETAALKHHHFIPVQTPSDAVCNQSLMIGCQVIPEATPDVTAEVGNPSLSMFAVNNLFVIGRSVAGVDLFHG
jgi:hypothetical protein